MTEIGVGEDVSSLGGGSQARSNSWRKGTAGIIHGVPAFTGGEGVHRRGRGPVPRINWPAELALFRVPPSAPRHVSDTHQPGAEQKHRDRLRRGRGGTTLDASRALARDGVDITSFQVGRGSAGGNLFKNKRISCGTGRVAQTNFPDRLCLRDRIGNQEQHH